MKIKIFIVVLLLFCSFGPPLLINAETKNNNGEIFRKLARALYYKDESLLRSLTEPSVKIPEIRENTTINSLQTLPSPHKNMYVMIGSFKDCLDDGKGGCGDRIAFIWEVSMKNDKITKINVISDVANPYMNELILTKEYKEKFNKQIFGAGYFPFKITHVSGKISGEKITIYYKNIKMTGVVKIQARPTAGEIILPKMNMYKQVALQNGGHGFIGKLPVGYEIIFLIDNIQYNVKLYSDGKHYKPSKSDLIKVANSMFPPK
ncbi:hypothetical protein [Bacillus sp. USDA818B3_A]|uniref:hypothetical protein n=1 Tax=Bacillus sp. USDA818B3_A TaxID=2698834 RepID=UPI00136CA589|nr:hypothetical protein [Bacillus sp. USDA818B3_A]